MKKFVLIFVVIASLVAVKAQTVTVPGLTDTKRKSMVVFQDGDAATISWVFDQAPIGTVAEVSMRGIVDGQEAWSYTLTEGEGRNLPTGSLAWIPRTLQATEQLYKIKVTWMTAVLRTVVAEAETPIFKVRLTKPRSITLSVPTSDANLGNLPLIKFSWQSTGLPAGAKIQLLGAPINDPERLLLVRKLSDTGGFVWWVGDATPPTPPGTYVVQAFYVNEYGVYSEASNSQTITLKDN